MIANPLAGQPAPRSLLVDVPRLITAYYADQPDPGVPAQRVAFGTSGHRGSSFTRTFNEDHILAVAQAVCEYRHGQAISGPLYLGMDTHALSMPAFASVLEVLAAHGVETLISAHDAPTPTPVISHAILTFNRGKSSGLADGIVITPSHNPPHDGGIKYNPPHGGPAGKDVTDWIQARANALLEAKLAGVARIPYARALAAARRHHYVNAYVSDLNQVVDLEIIKNAKLRLGVDPLGGASVPYWAAIADRYGLDLDVVNDVVDPTFRFMTVDWDGQIRMDPSSPSAMQGLIGLKDRFQVAFACDTDADRHGIVTRSTGLLPPNHYLSVAVAYLYGNRPDWKPDLAIGKTVVTTQLIARIATALGRKLYEVPVGFKWFVDGLHGGTLGFVGEESAGAAFLRRDGGVWTTDKDGLIPALLAGEMTARTGKDPGELYQELVRIHGEPTADRVDAKATPEQKQLLGKLSAAQVKSTELAGEKITKILDRAPGNDAPIGGLKVESPSGWFAARPSGTEDIYKIYAESFRGKEHLGRLLEAAQQIVDSALKSPG